MLMANIVEKMLMGINSIPSLTYSSGPNNIGCRCENVYGPIQTTNELQAICLGIAGVIVITTHTSSGV